MTRVARQALAWAMAAALPAGALAQAPDCRQPGAGVAKAESGRYVVLYRTVPAKLAVSSHFALEIAVCPKPGAAPARGLSVDATMPAHGHGMNYKAVVREVGEGRYRAEGLLFHMPGRWQLVFDVRTADKGERVTHDLSL